MADDDSSTGLASILSNIRVSFGIQYVYASAASTSTAPIEWFTCQAVTANNGNAWIGSSAGAQNVFDPADVARLEADYALIKKQDRDRRRAEIKARRLFKRVVGDIAYQRFKELGYHEIRGGETRTRYRLVPGSWVRVMDGESDRVEHELCCHLPWGIPWFDTLAVQHLMLSSKVGEGRFLAVANRHRAGEYPIAEMANPPRAA